MRPAGHSAQVNRGWKQPHDSQCRESLVRSVGVRLDWLIPVFRGAQAALVAAGAREPATGGAIWEGGTRTPPVIM